MANPTNSDFSIPKNKTANPQAIEDQRTRQFYDELNRMSTQSLQVPATNNYLDTLSGVYDAPSSVSAPSLPPADMRLGYATPPHQPHINLSAPSFEQMSAQQYHPTPQHISAGYPQHPPFGYNTEHAQVPTSSQEIEMHHMPAANREVVPYDSYRHGEGDQWEAAERIARAEQEAMSTYPVEEKVAAPSLEQLKSAGEWIKLWRQQFYEQDPSAAGTFNLFDDETWGSAR